MSLAAVEKGRSAIALHNDGAALEELGNYLRTLAIRTDDTYRFGDSFSRIFDHVIYLCRDKDGVVLDIVNQ